MVKTCDRYVYVWKKPLKFSTFVPFLFAYLFLRDAADR